MRFKLFNKNFIKNQFVFRFSIKYRLLFYFLFLVFLPTTIISVTIYDKSQNIITERVNSSTTNNLAMIETSFKQKLDVVNDVMSLIYFSPELQSVFASPYFLPQSQTILSPQYSFKRNNLINEMSSLDRVLDSYSDLNTTTVTLFPRLYVNNRPEYLFFNSSEKVTDFSEIQHERWYSEIPPVCQYYTVGLNKIETSAGRTLTLRLAKKLFGLNNVQLPFAGVLTVDVSIDSFNSILKNYKPSPGSIIFLLDKNNLIVSSSDNDNVGTYLSKRICNAKDIIKSGAGIKPVILSRAGIGDMIVSYGKISAPDYVIVSMSPVKEMYGELVSFNKVMVIVLIICLVLSLGFALFLSDNISYPIRKLVKSMSIVEDGNFDVNLSYKRNDEFAFLISAYNKMVGQIKELINKLYKSELNKKEAELKSLQAQINPHFLYNTLDSVNWLALKHNVPDISTMVTSLSDFFRYSLNKGRNIIPLRDERNQVQSYLEIQKIRFKDKLDYSIDFHDDILDYQTVKLILQPIVENAIVHGIEKRRGKGLVDITAAKIGDSIEISISDNGIGSDISELNSLLSGEADNTKSYGIRNVHERIQNTFGEDYGLTFSDNYPAGVTVTIKIPAMKKMEGQDVKNDNS
jgi:two-component system sensor histidine kinase YesM